MNQYKSLSVWTLMANFFIVIAAGHGIGTLGLLEFYFISNLLDANDTPSFDSILVSKLFYSAFINFFGQLSILTAFFTKRKLSTGLKLLGLLSLVLAFCILLSYLWNERTIIITIITAIPFIILSILLSFRSLKNEYKTT